MPELTGWLDSVVPERLKAYHVPGAAIALVADGQAAWAAGYGLADEASKTPVTPDSVFQVASISKSITAWGVMKLVEAGQLDLDAPVEQYLKSWHLPASELDQNGVTLRRLLSHTAGLSSGTVPGAPPGEPFPTLVEVLSGFDDYKGVRLERQPGSSMSYSNGGYALIQLVIEDVTAEPFAAYMQREILSPLGMSHSTFQWQPGMDGATATGYKASGQPVGVSLLSNQAAGGLFASVGDMALWAAAGMPTPEGEPAGRGVLQPASLALLYASDTDTGGGYGLGHAIETLPNGVRLITHSGDIEGWRGQYALLPDQGDGIVVLTNSNTSRYLIAEVICAWSEWAAASAPKPCQTYQIVYGAVPMVAGAIGLGSAVSLWRLIAQARSGKRRLDWPPKSLTQAQTRAILLPIVVIAVWWLFVSPRLGMYLPPSFTWVSLAITLWCLISAAWGLTTRMD